MENLDYHKINAIYREKQVFSLVAKFTKNNIGAAKICIKLGTKKIKIPFDYEMGAVGGTTLKWLINEMQVHESDILSISHIEDNNYIFSFGKLNEQLTNKFFNS